MAVYYRRYGILLNQAVQSNKAFPEADILVYERVEGLGRGIDAGPDHLALIGVVDQ